MKKMVLVDVNAREIKPVVIDCKPSQELYEIYKLLNCDLIDIPVRSIGGKNYHIFCDDVGMFADDPQISAIYRDSQTIALVGNLLIAGESDSEGDILGLDDEDVKRILANSLTVVDTHTLLPQQVLVLDETWG